MADPAIVEWWTKLQAASPVQRSQMSDALGRSAPAGGAEDDGPGEGDGEGGGRPRRGRRRRGGRNRRGGRGGAPAG
jgi:hypothetical protein